MYDKAGIRFTPEKYVEVNVGDEITLKTIIGGVETDYNVTGGITVEPITITENGTYDADDGKAYNPVVVNVEQGGGYAESLLWENPNPGTGFNIDKDCGYIDNFDYYKIEWRKINNESVYLSTLWKKEDIIAGLCAMTSVNEAGDLFARNLVIEEVEVSADPPMIEQHFIAKGLCAQVGVSDTEKRFRCLPYKIYGVTGIEF